MNALASSSRLNYQSAFAALQTSRSQKVKLIQSRSSSTQARPRTFYVKRPDSQRVEEVNNIKGGKDTTLWQSWLNLRPSTRLLYGVIVAVIAVGGLKISDALQARMPAPGEEAGQGSSVRKPKLFGFSVVDRKEA